VSHILPPAHTTCVDVILLFLVLILWTTATLNTRIKYHHYSER